QEFVVVTPVFRDYRAWRAKWTKLVWRKSQAWTRLLQADPRVRLERRVATDEIALHRNFFKPLQAVLYRRVGELPPAARTHDDGHFLHDAGPRRRPSRADGRLRARQGREPRDRRRGRGPGRRAGEDGRGRRLPLRPRRPPLLHEVGRGRHALARGARRRVPPAPADVADLLEQALP